MLGVTRVNGGGKSDVLSMSLYDNKIGLPAFTADDPDAYYSIFREGDLIMRVLNGAIQELKNGVWTTIRMQGTQTPVTYKNGILHKGVLYWVKASNSGYFNIYTSDSSEFYENLYGININVNCFKVDPTNNQLYCLYGTGDKGGVFKLSNNKVERLFGKASVDCYNEVYNDNLYRVFFTQDGVAYLTEYKSDGTVTSLANTPVAVIPNTGQFLQSEITFGVSKQGKILIYAYFKHYNVSNCPLFEINILKKTVKYTGIVLAPNRDLRDFHNIVVDRVSNEILQLGMRMLSPNPSISIIK